MTNMLMGEIAGNRLGTHQMSPSVISRHQLADQVSMNKVLGDSTETQTVVGALTLVVV